MEYEGEEFEFIDYYYGFVREKWGMFVYDDFLFYNVLYYFLVINIDIVDVEDIVFEYF